MTPELERDFETVREGLPEGYLGDAERFREALNRIRSELEAKERLNTDLLALVKWLLDDGTEAVERLRRWTDAGRAAIAKVEEKP